jgi:hypothetical protein
MIRGIVETGRLSDPEAARFLTDVIIRRRDKVVAYWISRTNPLDRFELHRNGTTTELMFDNAAIRVRAAAPGATYKVQWSALDNMTGAMRPIGVDTDSRETRTTVPDAAWGSPDDAGSRYATVAIETIHPTFPHWKSPVRVTVRNRNGSLDIVGIERPTGQDRARAGS